MSIIYANEAAALIIKYAHVFALHCCVLFSLSPHCLFMVYIPDIIQGYLPDAEVIM